MKSIAELLCEKHDEGALAAAIRRQGIYFKDVHEHLIPCKPDSPEARTALEWLADNAAWPRNYDEAGRLDPLNWAYEMLDNKEEDPFCTAKYLPCFVFGWPENKLPDFSDPSVTTTNASAETRKNDSFLLLIVILAQEIQLDLRTQEAVPALKRLIDRSGLGTMSENTLRNIVRAARATIDRKSA